MKADGEMSYVTNEIVEQVGKTARKTETEAMLCVAVMELLQISGIVIKSAMPRGGGMFVSLSCRGPRSWTDCWACRKAKCGTITTAAVERYERYTRDGVALSSRHHSHSSNSNSDDGGGGSGGRGLAWFGRARCGGGGGRSGAHCG